MPIPPTPKDLEEAAIRESDMATARLVALALTLPTRDFRNELWGRSHAWASIASSQASAIQFVIEHPTDQREMAARALARAGHQLRDLRQRQLG
jgi:hypothetical protein